MVVLDRIKESSKEKGWALSFLARKLGLTASYFTDVKNGKTKISDDRLTTIADILNTTPEYLKGETDIKEKPATNAGDGLSDYDARVIAWFRSLPPEKREAILNLGDGPKE
jgi:transcriptional regulator with XRE-family HTH domain